MKLAEKLIYFVIGFALLKYRRCFKKVSCRLLGFGINFFLGDLVEYLTCFSDSSLAQKNIRFLKEYLTGRLFALGGSVTFVERFVELFVGVEVVVDLQEKLIFILIVRW